MFPIHLSNVRLNAAERTLLDGVDLTIGGDGITVFLGPNGAGKSLLMRLLSGLLIPDGGSIEWNGGGLPGAGIAMMFQQPMLLRASVFANVALALKPLGMKAADIRRQTMDVLQRVGLGHRSEDSARLLSGGEKQRLALARAWVTKPRLLLLDEPTASLDPTATDAVEAIIREIRTEGAKILMATHNLGQAMRISDDIVFIESGKVREQSPTARFFSTPQSPEAKLFIQGELPWRIAFES
jgi:tungstate transport system ATP-binding protein